MRRPRNKLATYDAVVIQQLTDETYVIVPHWDDTETLGSFESLHEAEDFCRDHGLELADHGFEGLPYETWSYGTELDSEIDEMPEE